MTALPSMTGIIRSRMMHARSSRVLMTSIASPPFDATRASSPARITTALRSPRVGASSSMIRTVFGMKEASRYRSDALVQSVEIGARPGEREALQHELAAGGAEAAPFVAIREQALDRGGQRGG